jgi:hypothetical protein
MTLCNWLLEENLEGKAVYVQPAMDKGTRLLGSNDIYIFNIF